MPLERLTVSVKSFAEELGFDPSRFVGLGVNRQDQTISILLEPDHDTDERHLSTTDEEAESRREEDGWQG